MSRVCDPTTRGVWRRRLERFARSGLPVARFCSQEGVSVASFYHWRKKLVPRASRQRGAARLGAFRALTLVPAAAGVSIHLAGGTRIEVRTENLEAIRAVVAEAVRLDGAAQGEGVPC